MLGNLKTDNCGRTCRTVIFSPHEYLSVPIQYHAVLQSLPGPFFHGSSTGSTLYKEIEELDFETRIRKRDELLAQKFSNNEQK